ncbi:MAG: hypothetical protein KQH63_04385 [Desulfobulbaceae bacterium]|nr:hypothetical protein [Desulfobulbaceae bacterium]
MEKQIYAWARKIDSGPLKGFDHTYVTDYSPESTFVAIGDVVKNSSNFWYCHGYFHSNNSQLVPQCQNVTVNGNIKKINCLCKSNDKRYNGTVISYLRDGVCHQVSNQILYMTTPRIEVTGVKGSGNSYGLYGHFGRKEAQFLQIAKGCAVSTNNPPPPHSKGAGNMKSATYMEKLEHLMETAYLEELDDEEILRRERFLMIEERLGDAIPQSEKEKIVSILEQANFKTDKNFKEMQKGNLTGEDYIVYANKINRAAFKQIAKVIGDDKYHKLFGCSIDETPDLGDPSIAREAYGK